MIRTTVLLSVLLVTASQVTFPQARGDTGDSTICINRAGPMDRYIPPVVISDSDAGITRGRARMLENNKLDLIEAQVVDEATMERLTTLILATPADDIKQTRSWGAVEFVILFPNSERTMILGKVHTMALLESLSAATKDADLRSDLKEFLDYERSLANFNARPSDSLVADRLHRRERGPSRLGTTTPPGSCA